MAYAKGTKTEIGTTETQIKTMLRKAGAVGTAFMEAQDHAIVAFHLNDRAIKFKLPLPRRDEFSKAGFRGLAVNSPKTVDNLWMQACRERWRQLHLCIKAKLESVEQNIESFDDAFLAHIQMPDGETVGDKMRVELVAQLGGRPLRPLLGGPS